MKKIFTFLFFAGLMTTAMAQNGGYNQHRNQNGDSRTQPNTTAGSNQGYGQAGNGYGQPSQRNNGYSQNNDYQQNNGYSQNSGYQQNDQRYTNNQNGNDRRYDDRSNDRRFHENDHFDHRAYGYEKRNAYERYDRGRGNARIVIRFGQPSCF